MAEKMEILVEFPNTNREARRIMITYPSWVLFIYFTTTSTPYQICIPEKENIFEENTKN